MRQPSDTAPQTPELERLQALVRSLSVEERARLTAGIDA